MTLLGPRDVFCSLFPTGAARDALGVPGDVERTCGVALLGALIEAVTMFDSLGAEEVGEYIACQARRFVRREVEYRKEPHSSTEFGLPIDPTGWLVTAAWPPLGAADRQALGLLATMASAVIAHHRRLTELIAHSRTDALTGLANRRLVDEALEGALARSARSQTRVGVILLDLDGFKLLNDVHGHQAGDEALVSIAAALVDEVRAGDTVGRIGGDEFVVVVPDASERGLHELAERLTYRLDGVVKFPRTPLGASVGTALSPGAGTEAAWLLQCADKAMYAVKRRRQATRTASHPDRAGGSRTDHASVSALSVVRGDEPQTPLRSGQPLPSLRAVRRRSSHRPGLERRRPSSLPSNPAPTQGVHGCPC